MGFIKRILASVPDFQICGYNAYLGVNIVFLLDTSDEQLKEQIRTNKVTRSERNFIVSTINEYFCDTVGNDNDLCHYAIGNILIDYMNGNFKLPDALVNKEYLEQVAFRKTKIKDPENPDAKPVVENLFNKNKFNSLPASEQVKCINDLSEFFDEVWARDYLKPNYDLTNLVILKEDANNLGEDEKQQTAKSSFRQKLATILKQK